MTERSEPRALIELGSKPLFGIAYRRGQTAWKLAPYPFLASVERADRLRTWLESKLAFPAELRIAQVILLPNEMLTVSGGRKGTDGH